MLLSFFYALLLGYAFINVPNYPTRVENRDSRVAYFENPLLRTPLSVENRGDTKYKLDIQMCKKKLIDQV